MGIYTWRTLTICLIATASVLVGVHAARAQSSNVNSSTATSSVGAYKAKLQDELNQLESEIQQQQQILNQKQSQQTSLQSDIAILTAQITQAQLSIQARNIEIEQLNADIGVKDQTITSLNAQLQGELQSLAGILREEDQLDSTPLIVAILSSEDLSTFFSDLQTFNSINAGVQQSLNQIQGTTQTTQQQASVLEQQQGTETQLLQAQQLQKEQIQQQENEKNQILTTTKGQEKAYEALIAQTQQSAAQIRSALFSLTGSAAIPFGDALTYANEAEQKTGIRPAFLLGVITEESNLGANIGTGTYTVDMSPSNIPAFLAITKSLGLDPNTLPVSKRQWYGWGGAMGPAQFIPSTWALYAGYSAPSWSYSSSGDRIGMLTGDTPPNPWNPKDAFMAAALYLTDDGAAAQTPSAEYHAAMCYLTGCANAHDPSLAFYGNSVAQFATKYQQEINIINGSSGS